MKVKFGGSFVGNTLIVTQGLPSSFLLRKLAGLVKLYAPLIYTAAARLCSAKQQAAINFALSNFLR